MSKRKHQDFSKPNLIIAVLAVLIALGSFGFSIYLYETSTRPTTLSGLVDSRLNRVQSELQSAEQTLLDVRADGNLTRLQDMVDQAQVLYREAVHDWVQFNLVQAEHEALQAENIIHEFNQEAQLTLPASASNIGVVIGPIIAVIVIALVAYWFLSRRKLPAPPTPGEQR